MKHSIDIVKQNSNVIHGNFKKSLPDKKVFNRIISSDWHKIRRANDPTKGLSEKAQNLLSAFVYFINKDGVAICDHEDLTEITRCKNEQNNNLLRQLKDILDIKFYLSIKIENRRKKSYNTFVITFTQNGQLILENPGAFYTKSYNENFQKNITEFPKNLGDESKKFEASLEKNRDTLYNIDKITLEEELRSNYSSSKVDKDIFKEETARERAKEISPSVPKRNSCNDEPVSQEPEQSGSNLESNSVYEVLHTAGEVSVETPPAIQSGPESIQSNVCYPRHLKDFYPLTDDDHQQLVKASKRNFTLAAMNEILLDMSVRVSGKDFVSKGSFLAYMTKVYGNEKRSEQLLNQEGFKLRNNMPEEERERDEHEEFLSKVLLDKDTSLDCLFKRSLADRETISETLPRKTAFNLLKAYVSSKTSGEYLILNLRFYVELTPNDKEYIMRKGKSIYEFQRNLDPDNDFSSMATITVDLLNQTTTGIQTLTKLIINMPSNITKTVSNVSSSFHSTGNVWGDIRRDLMKLYTTSAYNYKYSDLHWISKFKASVDEENKVITLKTTSKFLFDEVYNSCLSKYFGYSSDGEGYVLEDSALRGKYPYKVKIALVSETEINDHTEAKSSSVRNHSQTSQNTLVESNAKVLELSNYLRKAHKRGEMILAACEITELTPKKVNILVEKGDEIDESAKSFLRESIKFIYGDDVEIVTKVTRS